MRSEAITYSRDTKRSENRSGSCNLWVCLVFVLGLGLYFVFLNWTVSTAYADTDAAFQTGIKAYLKGDYATALRYWQPLAKKGDAPAQFNLGVLYAQGLGVKKDPAMAAVWDRRAAKKGYTPAQFNLGEAYFSGVGVAADMNKAVYWWTTAAKRHHVKAQYNLGYLYLLGKGLVKDRKQAIFWFQQAAAQSDPYAIKMLNSLGIKPVDTTSLTNKVTINKVGQTSEYISAKMATRSNVETGVGALPKKIGKTRSKSRPRTTPARITSVRNSTKQLAHSTSGNQPAHTKAEVKKSTPAVTVGGAKNAAWLQQLEADHYTVQLLADHFQRKIFSFYRRYRWDRPVAVFETVKAGKNWYKLVYGDFKSRALAKQVVALMPTTLQDNHPWIRSLASIQSEIASFQKSATNHATITTATPTPNTITATLSPQHSKTQLPVVTGVATSPALRPQKNTAALKKNGTDERKNTSSHGSKKVPRSLKQSKKKVPQVVHQRNSVADKLPPLQRARWYFDQKDYRKAYQTWLPLAQADIAEAQYNIGFLFEAGWGVKANSGIAATWYQRAAQRGYAKAQFNLALLYLQGNGVEIDPNLADYWLQSAADGGDRRAELYLKDARVKSVSQPGVHRETQPRRMQ